MSSAGISHNAPNGEMIVLDTIVRDNGGAGINVNGDIVKAVLDHVRSEHNQGGGFYLEPTAGSVGAMATITNSVFTHNGGHGIAANSVGGATVTIVVERSIMASNVDSGFVANVPVGSSGVATVRDSTLNDNGGTGLWILGAGTIGGGMMANVAHRNSVDGIKFQDMSMFILEPPNPNWMVFKGNMAYSNGLVDFRCSTTNLAWPFYLATDKLNHAIVRDSPDCLADPVTF
jgi:hypothetical protein